MRQLAIVVPIMLILIVVLRRLPSSFYWASPYKTSSSWWPSFVSYESRESQWPTRSRKTVASYPRFRPLLMTALTSFIGHLPMIYATTTTTTTTTTPVRLRKIDGRR
jgi:hypothetical protein